MASILGLGESIVLFVLLNYCIPPKSPVDIFWPQPCVYLSFWLSPPSDVVYLIDLMLHVGYYAFQLVLGGVLKVKLYGGKILVKHGVKFNDVGGLSTFGDNGSE